jgi:hypothetical protein
MRLKMIDVLKQGQTPEKWSEILKGQGHPVSPAILRAKAIKHRQFVSLGRLMLLSPGHIEAILTAETNARLSRAEGG